jgi:caffeoyl-CoA O-methyltransferase
MTDIIDPAIDAYAERHTRAEPGDLADLAAWTRQEMAESRMLTGRIEGRLLKLLVQLVAPRLAVEVGTFTGYSALSIAEGLPEGGRLVTCERDPVHAGIASGRFRASPFGERISLRLGPALETIRALEGAVDFAFIDADKGGYPDYYEELLARTRSGGLLVLDNMLWSGQVLDPRDEESRTLADLNARIVADPRVENVLLPVRDGVQLVRRR